MNQTKIESFIESCINVASGFLLALVIWQAVAPYVLGYHITIGENIVLTSMFTIVSVIRGYVWRRFFNAGIHKAVQRWVSGALSWKA